MDSILRIPSVTGIDLDLTIAGPGARSYAFIVDWHIRVVAALAWFFLGTMALVGALQVLGPGDLYYAQFIYLVVLPSTGIYFLYHPVIEVLMRGQTPGKRIAGVRILAVADGGMPGIGAILIRNVFRLIDSLPLLYAIGLATTMFTKHHTRIGDIAAGTVLVYDETQSKTLLDELSAPAVRRLGLEHAQIIHDLLSRWKELRSDTRSQLARQLLTKVGVDVSGNTDAELETKLRELLA
jgi:uncharacterized RDD family membrane protein YckC